MVDLWGALLPRCRLGIISQFGTAVRSGRRICSLERLKLAIMPESDTQDVVNSEASRWLSIFGDLWCWQLE